VVVNCSVGSGKHKIYFKNPDAKKRERSTWNDINRAFSRPVNASDAVADYVPTQIISELFRTNGLDGVAYVSALGKGHNLAIFDIDAADVINCFLFEAKKIGFTFKEAASPYFVKKNNNP